MPIRRLFLIPLLLLTARAPAVAAQDWVSRIKAAPQDYRGRQFLVEGEVVEIRALSPRSERGLYRLVDGTDPAGILIRANSLPESGGPFRVRVRLAPELLTEGSLLLEEIERDPTGMGLAPFAIGLSVLGVAGLIVALVLFLRARREVRHLALGQPMWLIPSGPGTAGGEASPGKPTDFNYELHYVAEERSKGLDRRRRVLLAAMMLSAAVTVGGASMFGALRRADASRPAFVLLAPEIPPPARDDSLDADRPAPEDEAIRLGLAPTEPRTRPGVTAPSRDPREADTRRVEPPPRTAVAADTPVVRVDTAVAVEQPVVTLPPPPPPAAPVVRDTAPRGPSPEELRVAAREEFDAGARQFVAAVNARNTERLATLYPAGGDARRRERFLQFVREWNPTASLLLVDASTVANGTAEGGFTIGFRWRGDFGVQRQRDVRFHAALRRSGDGWSFAGASLLEAFP